jgi:hypothetical protein
MVCSWRDTHAVAQTSGRSATVSAGPMRRCSARSRVKLRVGRTLDLGIEGRVDREHEIAPDDVEITDHTAALGFTRVVVGTR